MQCHPQEIVALIQYQAGALGGIARAHGLTLNHVKPHGALYNDMMRDHDILRAVLEGVACYDASLPLMLMATADNGPAKTIAAEFGVPLLFEAFADRAYDTRGYLVPRSVEGSVYHDVDRIVEQSLRLAQEGIVTTLEGSEVRLEADTLCVHGDNTESVQAVKRIRQALDRLYAS
jgi:UPF0271 protein